MRVDSFLLPAFLRAATPPLGFVASGCSRDERKSVETAQLDESAFSVSRAAAATAECASRSSSARSASHAVKRTKNCAQQRVARASADCELLCADRPINVHAKSLRMRRHQTR
jgi:hypothetical protein